MAERVRRRRELAKRHVRPLKMRSHLQKTGFCGPASLKICFSHFGREYDEDYLGKLCRTTASRGTDHADMIRCAKSLGAKVCSGSDGTFRELRRLVLRERLPVIVGWYSPTDRRKSRFDPRRDEIEDHFSVVYHVSATHVYLMDPEEKTGRRRMTIGKFMKLWWDTDGPRDVRVDRWFMVMNFEKRTLSR